MQYIKDIFQTRLYVIILSLRIYIQISLEQWVVKSIEQHAICTYLTFHNFYVSDNDLKLTLFKVFQGLTYNDTLREMQSVCIADLIIIIFTFWCICLDVNVRLELNITLHRKKGVERHCLSFSRRNLFYGCLIWNKSYFECYRSLLQLNKLHRVTYKPILN